MDRNPYHILSREYGNGYPLKFPKKANFVILMGTKDFQMKHVLEVGEQYGDPTPHDIYMASKHYQYILLCHPEYIRSPGQGVTRLVRSHAPKRLVRLDTKKLCLCSLPTY